MECYANFHCLKDAFRRFLDGGVVSVVNVDDPFLAEYPATVTYGLCKRADYYADNLRSENGKYAFDCFERGKFRGLVQLNVCGKHNVYNALAAIATARQLFIPFSVIINKLAEFSGVDRRNHYLGTFQGKKIIADYAHHPTEIQATLFAFREGESGEFAVVFQPHTYERTRYLYNGFVSVLNGVNNLALYQTYAARNGGETSQKEFLLNDISAPLLKSENELKGFIENLPPNVTRVLILGAGDIFDVACNLVKTVTT